MEPLKEAEILACWARNAEPWVTAVRERRIDTRRLVTDQAIIEAIRKRAPRTVLDIGCGEGWLTRALCAAGIEVLGVDAVPALIDSARRAGGDFRVLSFEQIAAGELEHRSDVAVCNFSLLGDESVRQLLGAVPTLLNPAGALLVQTLHPLIACGELPYEDGWREGSWAGLAGEFTRPAPWYFRTLASWLESFRSAGLLMIEMTEPLHPATRRPASVIFCASREGRDASGRKPNA